MELIGPAAVAGAAAGAAGATCARSPSCSLRAERPAMIAGRGAVLSGAGPALRRLGELSGAILATSAVANGLFADDPFAVGISGGFATPTGQRLLAEADLIVAFGASLNNWTTRHGALVANATVVQVDRDADAIGAHRPVDHGLAGDARETAEALIAALERPPRRDRRRRHRAAQHRAGGGDRRRQLARRALRALARLAGPARPEPRARRDAPGGADRGRGLGRVHGLPVDVPARAGRPRLRLPAGLPVRRARARQRDRRRRRAAGPADGRPRSATAGC